ncbi:MAG: hypothetical protein K1Y36_29155 [Blastocatellia bacterium]|nr:hypothetical protein [Blastocatellia bacterium]
MALAKDGTAVLDDKPARQQAETINVKYTGTVGLLNTSVQKGWISGTSALTVVTVIVQNGGRLPKPNGSTDWDQYLNSIA